MSKDKETYGDLFPKVRPAPRYYEMWKEGTEADMVNHPPHYGGFSHGAQVIDITECLNFNRGNVVKYVARAGRKDDSDELEDLRKAQWYLTREIERMTGGQP